MRSRLALVAAAMLLLSACPLSRKAVGGERRFWGRMPSPFATDDIEMSQQRLSLTGVVYYNCALKRLAPWMGVRVVQRGSAEAFAEGITNAFGEFALRSDYIVDPPDEEIIRFDLEVGGVRYPIPGRIDGTYRGNLAVPCPDPLSVATAGAGLSATLVDDGALSEPEHSEGAAAAKPAAAAAPLEPCPRLEPVHFEFGTTTPASIGDLSVLAQAGRVLAEHRDFMAHIAGHTDSEGTQDFNRELADERAARVRTWLIEHHQVDPTRLTISGHADVAPVASNETVDGRAANRRVEIRVVAAESCEPDDSENDASGSR